ncbi:hypothetical protein KX729_17575 [Rhizobium sp. XQZ8]|uniref:hypothetical protein n=1 Tax=Rhizobium populisoli TaxID=2859785 RepID=UPI001CA58D80|nr:hypothetical protein [Rhizobium populisoli]MBW6423271.1 hypothetical protein [Rhizobium populisoli]
MSGLETAIRNALDRSDRADRETRSRIYQSARQALEAGLRKQGVSDRLIIMQQHELLDRKIHDIEMEEQRRLAAPAAEPIEVDVDGDLAYAAEPEPAPVFVDPPRQAARPQPAQREPQISVDSDRRPEPGFARQAPPVAAAAPANPSVAAPSVVAQPIAAEVAPDMRAQQGQSAVQDAGNLGNVAVDRSEHLEFERSESKVGGKQPKPVKVKRVKGKAAAATDTGLNIPPERSAKPRKRRGFLSHLLTWMITLAIVAAGCWWFYQSGMVQSFIEEAEKAADQPGGLFSQGQNPAGFDPRRGFSDEWREIFAPSKVAAMKPGPQARVEAVAASEGQAVRILSATSGEGGDISIDVPVEVLRDMAGKSSTVALTLQSGGNNLTQLSVRCDFGSLGTCSRHRFTATQEKLEALFRVSFDRSLAPTRPGRLILNSGIDGADRPVLVYSVRVLPGQ